jgi:hypothetical protein
MSKLDDILAESENVPQDLTKLNIKELAVQIVNTTELVGPPQPQSQMLIRDLIRKFEQL